MNRHGAIAGIIISCLYLSNLSAQPSKASPLPSQVEVHLKSDSGDTWLNPSVILGILGVLGGLTGVLIQHYWQRLDADRAAKRAERERLQAHVLDSIKWFEGKTQKRSIGIAVIEGNWEVFPDLRPTWVSVLANQAVYLLAQSKGEEDAALEQENLTRIVALLTHASGSITASQKQAVLQAFDQNRKGHGLRGVEAKVAEWKRTFA